MPSESSSNKFVAPNIEAPWPNLRDVFSVPTPGFVEELFADVRQHAAELDVKIKVEGRDPS